MSGRSRGPALAVDSVIKHKNKTQPFHSWDEAKGTPNTRIASFGDHSLYLSFSRSGLFTSLHSLFAPVCPPSPPLNAPLGMFMTRVELGAAGSCRASVGVVGSRAAASCRGDAAHSLFSMSTANKCLRLCGKASAIQIISSQCIPEQE